MTCQARRHIDQVTCERCGLYWDSNDPEPPQCKTGHELFLEAREKLHDEKTNAERKR